MVSKDLKTSQKKSAKTSVVASKLDCPQCKDGPEYYRMLFNQYKFDVDQAREIVSDGRVPVELDNQDVQHSLNWSHIHRPHLAHVNTQFPGIIAHYWYPGTDGQRLHGHVLIDGHHRAAKVFESNEPFYAYVLTEEESRTVTMRSPMKAVESVG